MPVATPPLAWRMRYHRMRPSIEASIASAMPGIDARQAEVAATCLDKEGRNHSAASISANSVGTEASCSAAWQYRTPSWK
jgi:hypothetical protein